MSTNTVSNHAAASLAAKAVRAGAFATHGGDATQDIDHIQRVVSAVSRVPGRIRRDLREDMRSAAMLAYLETRRRHDADRGVPAAGHAYPRMRGTVLDMLSDEQRHRNLGSPNHDSSTTLNTERVRARLTVEKLVNAAGDELRTGERVVLHEVYVRGRPLGAVGEEQGWSRSQAVRRNQGLLDRLRRAAGVPTAAEARAAREAKGDELR